jgi:hypothetical protein
MGVANEPAGMFFEDTPAPGTALAGEASGDD